MRSHRAFTLVELLTVVAVIGVLAGLLVPVVGAVRNKARSAECLSNLRQVGAASQLYTHEHKGLLPSIGHDRDETGGSLSWSKTLATYLGPDFIGRCPGQPEHPAKVGYGWNDLATTPSPPVGRGIPFTACRTPSATILLAELPTDAAPAQEHIHFAGAARGVTPAFFRENVNTQAHGSSSNYLFVDGHARSLTWAEVQRRLTPMPSHFVNP
jgi:prepilin-type N-terminal cleavage/methylation domain-containing protein/prepilin-type processing-associated H-X9-DG protein